MPHDGRLVILLPAGTKALRGHAVQRLCPFFMLGATGSETGGGTQQAGRGSAAALNRMHRTRPGGHQVPLTQQSNHHRARGMSSSPAAVMQRRSQDRDSHCATRFAENQNTIAKIQWGRRPTIDRPVKAAKTHNMPHWGARRARVRAPHQARAGSHKSLHSRKSKKRQGHRMRCPPSCLERYAGHPPTRL